MRQSLSRYLKVASILIFYCITISNVFAASTEKVKNDIYAALSTPLPITIIGPLTTRDVTVTKAGDAFDVILNDSALMGFFPVGDIAFTATPQGEDQYRITNFKLPQKITLPGEADIEIGSVDFDGLWSTQSRSYLELKMGFNDVSISPPNSTGSMGITFAKFGLDVQKQTVSNSTQSHFVLTAMDLDARLPVGRTYLRDVEVQLLANGEKPVDLYALISRIIVNAAIKPDTSALLRIGQQLIVNPYEKAQIKISGNDLEFQPRSRRTNSGKQTASASAKHISATIDLNDISPENWQSAELILKAVGVDITNIEDIQLGKLDQANITFQLKDIPISQTYQAIQAVQNYSSFEPNFAKLISQGLLNFSKVAFGADVKGFELQQKSYAYSVDGQAHENLITFRFNESYANSQLSGFKQGDAKYAIKFGASGILVDTSGALDHKKAQNLEALYPQELRYDLEVSDLQIDFLRALIESITITSRHEDPSVWAAPLATYLASVTPTISQKDFLYQSNTFKLSAQSNLRYFPMYLLSMTPYEGETSMQIEGYKKLIAYLTYSISQLEEERDFSSERQIKTVSLIRSLLQTLKVVAVEDGASLNWVFKIAQAKDTKILINDRAFYLPDISRLLGYASMAAFGGGMGRF